jgi:hypothetical protein
MIEVRVIQDPTRQAGAPALPDVSKVPLEYIGLDENTYPEWIHATTTEETIWLLPTQSGFIWTGRDPAVSSMLYEPSLHHVPDQDDPRTNNTMMVHTLGGLLPVDGYIFALSPLQNDQMPSF